MPLNAMRTIRQSIARVLLLLTKVDKIANLDITGTLCYAIEETLNVFKAGAAQIGRQICDPFASLCIDWIDRLFGFSLREVYIVKVIIKARQKLLVQSVKRCQGVYWCVGSGDTRNLQTSRGSIPRVPSAAWLVS